MRRGHWPLLSPARAQPMLLRFLPFQSRPLGTEDQGGEPEVKPGRSLALNWLCSWPRAAREFGAASQRGPGAPGLIHRLPAAGGGVGLHLRPCPAPFQRLGCPAPQPLSLCPSPAP